MPKSLLTSPTELKLVNVGTDTLYVNFKFADERDMPTGDSLPADIASQLDDWQQEARKDHLPVPTALTFAYTTADEQVAQTLMMRSHGSSMWSWLLYSDDIKELKFAHGTVNKGLFCQVRFSSHLLHSIGAEQAIVAAEEMLYNFMGVTFYKQMSEVHLCADLQGFDFSIIRLLGEQLPFVSRVTNIRDRSVPPTEEEQEGGLSVGDIHNLEVRIEQEIAAAQQEYVHSPSILTAHRRVQTIDFGSHGSDLSAQIYNKTAEMKRHKKEFFEPIHRANGWDGESDIWRIEFRFKRAFLRKYELNEAFSVLSCLRLLWRYATEEWLRFVDLDVATGVNVSRLPTHPVWELIQHAYDVLGDDGTLARSLQSEQEARFAQVLSTKPQQVLEHVVSVLVTEAQGETCITEEEVAHLHHVEHPATFARLWLSFLFLRSVVEGREKAKQTELMDTLYLVQQTYQGQPQERIRAAVMQEFEHLLPEQIAAVLDRFASVRFEDVRTSLVRRSRRMSRLQACIAGALGYLRSAVALMPPDELPGFLGPAAPASRTQPDLLSSLVWFLDKARSYDKKKQRDHIEEVHKKRLRYGLVTAAQLEEERRTQGVVLAREDWGRVDMALDRLMHPPTEPVTDWFDTTEAAD